MKFSAVYITTKNKTEAQKIANELVKAKLAACVNIIGKIDSIYRWEGKIESAKETLLIAKTKKTLVSKLIKKVKKIHSYSCPCIVSLPISKGNLDYLKWIDQETK